MKGKASHSQKLFEHVFRYDGLTYKHLVANVALVFVGFVSFTVLVPVGMLVQPDKASWLGLVFCTAVLAPGIFLIGRSLKLSFHRIRTRETLDVAVYISGIQLGEIFYRAREIEWIGGRRSVLMLGKYQLVFSHRASGRPPIILPTTDYLSQEEFDSAMSRLERFPGPVGKVIWPTIKVSATHY